MDEPPPRRITFEVAGFGDRGPQGESLQGGRQEQDDDRHQAVVELMGVAQLLHPLADREQPADAEQHDPDEETGDVARTAVTEGVFLIGRTGRAPLAEQEQNLVTGVGDRMDGFGQHRGRPGDQKGDELRHRDPQIGRQRRQNRLRAALRAHPTILERPAIRTRRRGAGAGAGDVAASGTDRRTRLPVSRSGKSDQLGEIRGPRVLDAVGQHEHLVRGQRLDRARVVGDQNHRPSERGEGREDLAT